MPISFSFKVKVPSVVLDSKLVHLSISRMMHRKTGPELQKEFMKTVDGWSSPPKFKPHIHDTSGYLSTEVYTTSERYYYVNDGTEPHVILAKGRGYLMRFKTGYRPATRPRVIGSGRPQRFGNTIHALIVRHPGIEPREFDVEIGEQYKEIFEKDVQDAINDAVKGSFSTNR